MTTGLMHSQRHTKGKSRFHNHTSFELIKRETRREIPVEKEGWSHVLDALALALRVWAVCSQLESGLMRHEERLYTCSQA